MINQPEKFFEACITHHLVNYFDITFDKKIYPFSISQIKENIEGYDFGYEFSGKFFFIQYKRPFKLLPEDKYYWKIEINQLKTIINNSRNINTYYALPSFSDSLGWYDALDNTYFIHALKLESQINKKVDVKNVKTTSINPEKINLDNWKVISKQFEASLKNAVQTQSTSKVNIEDILNYCKSLDESSREYTWLYILEEDQ